MGVSAAAFPGEPKPRPPQEPAGFVAGGVIGRLQQDRLAPWWARGLVPGWATASIARARPRKPKRRWPALEGDKSALQAEKSTLLTEKGQLEQSNQTLSAQLEDVSQKVRAVQTAKEDASAVLDGLQGDVLFRTGSAEITADIAHQIQVLAQAVSKSPELKIRVDGYADPRGSVDTNLKLSQDRANAVRDLLLASGLSDEALEVNAYGKSQSTAEDSDGYALERRVRLTLQMETGAAVAQVGKNEQVGKSE